MGALKDHSNSKVSFCLDFQNVIKYIYAFASAGIKTLYKDGAIYLKVHLFLKTLFSEPLFIGSLVKLVSNSSTEK